MPGVGEPNGASNGIFGLAGTLATAAIVGLVVTVLDLKTTTAVSYAELSGSINRLSDFLEAPKELSGVNLSGLAAHVRCMEDHLESVDRRVLHIEQRWQRG